MSSCRYLPKGMVRTATSLAALSILATCSINGCKKHSDNSPTSTSKKVDDALIHGDATVAVHWLGKKQISTDTNFSSLVQIWNLPESVQLESHLLDQLALAPWRLLPGITNLTFTNSDAALLRPLLLDLVQEEWYFELRQETNKSPGVALAIHLS